MTARTVLTAAVAAAALAGAAAPAFAPNGDRQAVVHRFRVKR